MRTQFLYGESVTVLDERDAWLLVASKHENYEAWVLRQHFGEDATTREYFLKSPTLATINVRNILLPTASLLSQHLIDGSPLGALCSAEGVGSISDVLQLAKSFVGASYLWGGRTYFGIDCSGLVNVAHKVVDVHLPHDAQAQADQGELVDFLDAALPGDVAFFQNEEGRIVHVGILLSTSEIIHSSETNGGVAIDSIDVQGIVNTRTREHTHHLRVIKRYLNLQ
jgi:gamma-D-glutamyl-L-lysine dipeptidyl-peptidase